MVWEWNWVEDPRLAHQKRFQILPSSTFQFSISILPIGHPDISDLVLAKQATTLLAPPLPSTDHQHLSWQDINVHCPTRVSNPLHWWLIFRGIRQPGIPVSSTGSNPTEKNRNMTHYFWITFVPWRYANSTPDTKQWIEIKSLHFVSICSTDSNPIIDISDTFFCEKDDCGPLEQCLLSRSRTFYLLHFLLSSCPLWVFL